MFEFPQPITHDYQLATATRLPRHQHDIDSTSQRRFRRRRQRSG